MMLSELYGRIGQVLQEHGDAPIADIRRPILPVISADMLLNEKQVRVVFQVSEMPISENGNIKLKSYKLEFE